MRFFPSVNSSKKNNMMPLATNLTFLRHSIHDGTVRSIEKSDEGSGWMIQIRDNGYTTARISTYISRSLRLGHPDFFEGLEVGDPVVYHLDLPYLKHNQENNAYIVIPNQEKS